MKTKLKIFVFAALGAFVGDGFAGTFKHITVDGSFADWADVPLAYSQAQDTTNVVAYQKIYVANDENYLYLRFSIYGSDNPFTSRQNIFLDSDNNLGTGYQAVGHVGSEMLIQGGAGYQEKNGGFNEGAINGLNWLASPNGTGSEFEVRISRLATYASDNAPVFTNDTIALVLESEDANFVSGEWFPPAAGGLVYTFTNAPGVSAGQNLVTNFYTASTEDFPNPERGFYIQADSYASAPSPVPSNLASYRINGKSSPGNTYTAKISLLLRLFYLDTFVNAPISSNFLNSIQTDFDSIRAQGDKAVIRFAYNQDQTRPFNEPSKARILSHIAQLKPVLRKNSDVIATLQEGFIAAWGEGYFTDIFYTNGQANAQSWSNRAEVIDALLEALPPERMIQVRTPQMKQKYVYGVTVPTGSPTLSSTQAFSGSKAARIGFHNDCFLADSTDFGTFSDYDYGNGTSPQDITNLRNYLAQETRYAPMGGETCAVNPPTDDCAAVGGNADPDMAFSHYSFLNQGYNADVDDKWAAHGCMENIKRQLGYRLQLISGIFRTEAQPGQAIPLSLKFQNVGFASPFNPRGIELVLRNTGTGQKFFAALSRDTDARRWLPGTNFILNAQLSLPTNMPAGSYDLLLNLPDPAPSLYTNSAYSIRLANSNAVSGAGTVLGGVWEPATGYHNLRQTLNVNTTATNAVPGGNEIPVLNFSSVAETYNTWQARNFPSTPAAGLPDADPDGDGRVNLYEYAVGSNPNSPDRDSYLKVFFADDALFLSVKKGLGVKDVAYEVESSPSLAFANWSTSSVAILENDATALRARYDTTAAVGFLRLKITLE